MILKITIQTWKWGDLEEERQISKEEGQALAQKLQLPFFEISAKDNPNIYEGFEYIIDELINSDFDRVAKRLKQMFSDNKKKK